MDILPCTAMVVFQRSINPWLEKPKSSFLLNILAWHAGCTSYPEPKHPLSSMETQRTTAMSHHECAAKCLVLLHFHHHSKYWLGICHLGYLGQPIHDEPCSKKHCGHGPD